jgi:hypothetical protein
MDGRTRASLNHEYTYASTSARCYILPSSRATKNLKPPVKEFECHYSHFFALLWTHKMAHVHFWG